MSYFPSSSNFDDLIEIQPVTTTTPLDLTKFTNHVHSPAAGAIATFEGTTRDSLNGKHVLELRYEAYIPMAILQLESILSSARSKWNLIKVTVALRLSVVEVGCCVLDRALIQMVHVSLLKRFNYEGGGEPPHGSLGWAIDSDFGSLDALKQRINAEGAALQGSSWVYKNVKPDYL